MSKQTTKIILVGVVALIVGCLIYVTTVRPVNQKIQNLGAMIESTTLTARLLTSNGVTFGTSTQASNVTFLKTGRCHVLIPNTDILASSTQLADCYVSGAQSQYDVFFSNSTTSSPVGAFADLFGVRIISAVASTTNDYITFLFENNTGTGKRLSSGVASSVPYFIIGTTTPR